MSNNSLRIISGLILIGIVTACIFLGERAALVLVGAIGPLIIDEIIINFYGQRRFSKRYLLSQTLFVLAYWFFNFYQISKSSFSLFISAGILLDIGLAIYLFLIHQKSETLIKLFKMTSWITGFMTLLPLLSLSFIIHFPNWRLLLIGLLLLNFMVDTAAYFTGKKFGRHKLWEAVSPKKTIEGAIGGVVCSVIATAIFWDYFIQDVNILTIVFFAIVACCAQVGDLAQSKLKRQFEIKDSSSLIPGHGGVYDRVYSLFFVAPLYAFFLMANF